MSDTPTERSFASDFTIQQWCKKRGYSKTSFYKLRKAGRGPAAIHPPGGGPRITQKADREWEENEARLATEEQAQREQRERALQARMKALKAVASPNHPSKRGRISKLAKAA